MKFVHSCGHRWPRSTRVHSCGNIRPVRGAPRRQLINVPSQASAHRISQHACTYLRSLAPSCPSPSRRSHTWRRALGRRDGDGQGGVRRPSIHVWTQSKGSTRRAIRVSSAEPPLAGNVTVDRCDGDGQGGVRRPPIHVLTQSRGSTRCAIRVSLAEPPLAGNVTVDRCDGDGQDGVRRPPHPCLDPEQRDPARR